MSFLRRQPQTLAIIGNGFDLNHGYKTNYEDFINTVSHPDLDKFRSYCENEESITNWFWFEENIRILSEKMFRKSMTEDCDFEANRAEVAELRRVFQSIHTLLCEYLKAATSKSSFKKKTCIKRHLNKNSVAINFNYTKTAERYTNNIIYVHGSLEEEDIILGFDYRDIGCLEQFEDMCWSKAICRESLAFRRYWLGEKGVNPDSEEYKSLLSDLESYQHWENTGRGLDDEIAETIPNYEAVDNFLKKYRANCEIPNISYDKIKTVAVLGHGIEADKVYLDAILSNSNNLKKVVIYRHDRESDSEFKRKADFFRPYCEKIVEIKY